MDQLAYCVYFGVCDCNKQCLAYFLLYNLHTAGYNLHQLHIFELVVLVVATSSITCILVVIITTSCISLVLVLQLIIWSLSSSGFPTLLVNVHL